MYRGYTSRDHSSRRKRRRCTTSRESIVGNWPREETTVEKVAGRHTRRWRRLTRHGEKEKRASELTLAVCYVRYVAFDVNKGFEWRYSRESVERRAGPSRGPSHRADHRGEQDGPRILPRIPDDPRACPSTPKRGPRGLLLAHARTHDARSRRDCGAG